jgi:hypothetical protein
MLSYLLVHSLILFSSSLAYFFSSSDFNTAAAFSFDLARLTAASTINFYQSTDLIKTE